jgi:hypothetical protein
MTHTYSIPDENQSLHRVSLKKKDLREREREREREKEIK